MKNTPSANDPGHNHLILTPHYSYPYPQCLNISESNHPIFISTPKDLIFLNVIPYPSRSSTHIRFSSPLLPYIPRLDASPISLRPYNTSSISIRTPIRIAPSPFLSAKCSTSMFVFADNYSLKTQISTASPAFTSITSQRSTPQQFAISVDRAIPRSLSRQVNTLTHLLSHSPHSLQAPSDSIQFMSNNNGQDAIICNRSNGYLKNPGSPTLHRTCTHNTLTLTHTLHSSTHLPTTLEQPPSPSLTARLPYRLPNPLQESNHESEFEQRNAWFTKRHKFDHETQHQSPIHAYDRLRNAQFTKCPDFEQRNAWFTKRHKFVHEKQHQSPIHAYDRLHNARFTKCPLSLKHLLSCITSSPQLHPTHPHSPQYNHHPHKTLHTHPTPSTTPLNSIPNTIPPYDKHTKHNNYPQPHPHKRRAL